MKSTCTQKGGSSTSRTGPPEEGSILLDAGSTTARLAEILPIDRQLIVLTNGLPIALSLATRPNVTVLFV